MMTRKDAKVDKKAYTVGVGCEKWVYNWRLAMWLAAEWAVAFAVFSAAACELMAVCGLLQMLSRTCLSCFLKDLSEAARTAIELAPRPAVWPVVRS